MTQKEESKQKQLEMAIRIQNSNPTTFLDTERI